MSGTDGDTGVRTTPGAATDEPRRRLHPLSPLLRGARSLVVIVAALSWQTLSQVGFERFAVVVLVLTLGAGVIALISWLNTGYHVVGRELRVQEGLLWRRNRAIPLERLQAVEVVRPLLAQLTGLAELRLEVVGGGKTEAPLAYLSVRDATALRERLLALAGGTPAAPAYQAPAARTPAYPVPGPPGGPAAYGPPAYGPAGFGPERQLHAVANRDLVISQLLTPQALFLPIGVAFVAVQVAMEDSWSFIAIASTVTAMAGVLLQPVRRVLQNWSFRVARDPQGRLAVRYGLVETRNQTVPLHRVQSVGVTWPLLWRGHRWLHLRVDVAGYAAPQPNADDRSDRLLPVGDAATARLLVAEVLPGVDLATVAVGTPPARARWLHPFALRAMGAGLTDRVFVSRWGLLTRELSMVPYARMQSVRVVQGPLQRLLRLATVYADTAGGRSGAAQDRDLGEAWALAAELSRRARLARRPDPARSPAAETTATETTATETTATETTATGTMGGAPGGPAAEHDFWRRPAPRPGSDAPAPPEHGLS